MSMKWRRETLSVGTLYSEIKNGLYWMDPPHQREVVHNEKWQSEIIESYMKGYLVPYSFDNRFVAKWQALA